MPRLPLTPLLLPLLLLASWTLPAGVADAVWAPPGVDLTRPRLLFRASERAAIQAKMDVQPTPPWLDAVLDQMELSIAQGAAAAADPTLDQRTKEAQRFKGRAARDLAFLYALDRTRIAGQVLPFPTPADREAAGDVVRDYLLGLYPVCRLARPPPLGGWDRDISTSEELLNWASAYDALAGAGYDFGADEATIVELIATLAAHLHLNYTVPSTATNFATFHQNNHRSKVGASLVMAGIALAEYVAPDDATFPGSRDPADWVEYGLDQFDEIVRIGLDPGDGGYAEGPFYWRFTSQNALPFARAWHALLGGAAYPAFGNLLPSWWRHPLHDRAQRWMLDMTLPDGSIAHIDDGNPGRAHYFGVLPPDSPDAAAFYWRWAHAPRPYEVEGNVDLGPDAIVLYDPSVVPAPPAGSPTAFYPEGGNAIFRSDWSDDAVVALALGEYDVASLFGRRRDGTPLVPQGHEHGDAGAFLLHAYGERLALDPGYFDFSSGRDDVAHPEHHNLILVDGSGPVNPVATSLQWFDPTERPPTDGQSRIGDTLDTGFLDAARITTSYGFQMARPLHETPLLARRFLFPDHRYLAIADTATSRDGAPHAFTWLLHGHGGGTDPGGVPGGSYADTPAGGRWERGAARLDSGFAVDVATPVFETALAVHESTITKDEQATHVVLRASASGEALASLMLVYPSPASGAAPDIVSLVTPGLATLVLDDPAGDRRVLGWHRAAAGAEVAVAGADSGLADASSDGRLALFDAHADGTLRLAHADDATRLAYAGRTWIETTRRGTLAVAPTPGAAEFVVANDEAEITLPDLPFAPSRADGACGFTDHGDGRVTVALGRERRFGLAAAAGNARPAADPGASQRIPLGTNLPLDGTASCDADGDALTPSWRLLSAPPGHGWSLAGADTWHPELVLDVAGPYRVELTVTDAQGLASLPREVLFVAGPACADGIDEDFDAMIDGDDPSCPYGAEQIHLWSEGCGLGPELAPVALALALARRRRPRHRRGSDRSASLG